MAEPTYGTGYRSFTDVNDNGTLDCGEPVQIVTAVLTNGDSPPLSGTITMPSIFAGTGLRFQPGTVQVDHFPIPTIGCEAEVLRGNSPGDQDAELRFHCPEDFIGDNQDHALVLSYEAIYHNTAQSSFTVTARFELDDGSIFDRSQLQVFPSATCEGLPADVEVTKTASGTGAPGSILLYAITVTNRSGVGIGGIQISDVVPDNTAFEAGASSAGWFCPATGPGSLCRLAVGNILAGQSVTRHLAVRIASPLPAGVTTITNTACAREGPDLIHGCGSTSTPTAGRPVIELSKSLQSGTGNPGATLVYRLGVANTGNQDSGPVTLTETVPANTTFAPAPSSTGWACSPGPSAGSTCTLTVQAVAAGSSTGVDFAVTIAPTLPAGTTQIANTACAAISGEAPDCATHTTPTTASPSLNLTKTLTGTGVPGSLLVYTLTLENDGNQGAASVSLRETVPDFTTFEAGDSTAGWSCTPSPAAGSTCTLAVGTVAAGAASTFAFVVRVVSPLPVGATAIGNTACAVAPGLPDRCDTVSTPTLGMPDIRLAKVYEGGPVVPGALLTFGLTVENAGNQDAGPLRVTETVPALTTFDAAASGPWTCLPDGNPGATCTLDLPGLLAGTSESLTFALRADADLPAGSQIGNVACAQVLPDGLEGCGSVETPVALSIETTLTVALQHDADASGSITPGDTLRYTLALPNTSPSPLLGLTAVPVLDPDTTFVVGSVTTDHGSVTSGNGAGNVFVEVSIFSLAPGGVATVTFDAVIARPLPEGVTRVSAQATTRGSNFPDDVSDDPATPVADDPTAVDVVIPGTPSPTHDIPTVGEYGLMMLALLLAAGALVHMRRQAAVTR